MLFSSFEVTIIIAILIGYIGAHSICYILCSLRHLHRHSPSIIKLIASICAEITILTILALNWCGAAVAILLGHIVCVVACIFSVFVMMGDSPDSFDAVFLSVLCFFIVSSIAGIVIKYHIQYYTPLSATIEKYTIEDFIISNEIEYDDNNYARLRRVFTYLSPDLTDKNRDEIPIDINVSFKIDEENPRVEIATYTQQLIDKTTGTPVVINERIALTFTTIYLPSKVDLEKAISQPVDPRHS